VYNDWLDTTGEEPVDIDYVETEPTTKKEKKIYIFTNLKKNI